MKFRPSLPGGIMARAGLALALALAVCVFALGAHARLAHAQASLVVSDCGSDSQLQADVAQANSDNAGDTITFSCGGTISLSQTLTITGSMTLDGSGQSVTLDGGNSLRVLLVNSGVNFTLNALTIAHGNGNARVGIYSGGGGGLFSQLGATVTITNSTFTGNSTSGYGGGAIFNDGAMTLTSSTVAGNSFSGAGLNQGGGLYNNYDYGTRTAATVTITNSTFTGNSAGYGGGIFNTGKMTLTNNTVTGNSGGFGGGFYNNEAVTFANSIVAGNSASAGGSNCYLAVVYLVTDDGYNLESGTDCRFTGTGDLQNTNPMLAAGLANNGGPSQTVALLAGSPAIDQIPAASCPATDQRGITRPDKGETSCDIGAYEYVDPDQDLTLSQPSNITVSATSAQGATVSYTVPTASDESGETPAPVVSCLPASGTTFAIGATTVTCTATDADDVNSPVSVSFTVYVDSVNLSSYPTLPNGAPNLSNANLSGAYLGGANLAGASLSGGNFSSANFSGAILSAANLANAKFAGATFTNANLTGANLANGNFSGANFSGATLTNANLTQANLVGATGLTAGQLGGVTWTKTTCPDNTNSSKDGGTCLNDLTP